MPLKVSEDLQEKIWGHFSGVVASALKIEKPSSATSLCMASNLTNEFLNLVLQLCEETGKEEVTMHYCIMLCATCSSKHIVVQHIVVL